MALCKATGKLKKVDGKWVMRVYDPVCDCYFDAGLKKVGGVWVWQGEHPTHGCLATGKLGKLSGNWVGYFEIPDTCGVCGDFCIQFDSASSSVAEEAGTASIKVIRAPNCPESSRVDYQVIGGTATSGVDYVLASGTLTFPPYSTSQYIVVTLVDDSTCEGNETVEIQLLNPRNAKLCSPTTHILTIVDDADCATCADITSGCCMSEIEGYVMQATPTVGSYYVHWDFSDGADCTSGFCSGSPLWAANAGVTLRCGVETSPPYRACVTMTVASPRLRERSGCDVGYTMCHIEPNVDNEIVRCLGEAPDLWCNPPSTFQFDVQVAYYTCYGCDWDTSCNFSGGSNITITGHFSHD